MLPSALNAANDDLLADYERRLREKEVRQADIYLRDYSEARKTGKSVFAALPRVDGQAVRSLSKRDSELFEMEEELEGRIRSEMTAEAIEQLDMLEG
jgi:hypothetical protein